ncbi:hypothetical protein HanXRQr2_Chr03g0110531 [Helianthus annuus]|uniref:Uncharacterized protein n=1 Tax=Helianthus annuus TaxID=4232 RepID=A0A9K3JEW9_HELAN|nr:hypothetical protein HanXRQr2_Chr03g0110531 [Helianthus annuus]
MLRSVNSPRCGTRWPAISPWFRSIPATVIEFGSSGAFAQKTPLYEHTSMPSQFLIIFSGSESMTFFHSWRA